ncbi:Uncharacterised protein [Vibrio cholerae]|nr:Uncharacterised protein [Vibrio cholerae]
MWRIISLEIFKAALTSYSNCSSRPNLILSLIRCGLREIWSLVVQNH